MNYQAQNKSQFCCTCAVLHVAQRPRGAYTSLAAIRRHRAAASSAASPTATSYRACAEPRPSTVHYSKPYDITESNHLPTLQVSLASTNTILRSSGIRMQCKNHISNKFNHSAHQRQQVRPGQTCVLHNLVASPTQSLPPFARAGLLQFLF